MSYERRSMNTTLKDARIFDDDSWDSSTTGLIKKELIETSDEEALKEGELEETYMDLNNDEEKDKKVTFKAEINIKQEIIDEDSTFSISREAFEKIQIKQEDLDQLTPIKLEKVNDNNEINKSRKSAIKNNLFKHRKSPYELPSTRGTSNNFEKETTQTDFIPFSSGIKENVEQKEIKISVTHDNKRMYFLRKKCDVESDPEVLRRRQKQIDFGKNTRGYENYKRLVPKFKRSRDDPRTPNKYGKYSRRGWDGLIKQWRLKLHKYDPEEDV